jgi:hypothetical protein
MALCFSLRRRGAGEMNQQTNNYAFIDSQNLNLSIKELGWNLDFKRFRIYLQEKYSITKAFLFNRVYERFKGKTGV